MKKKILSFIAYLDNGETANVTYKSEYWSDTCIFNEIVKCEYKNVDIMPVLRGKSGACIPLGIYEATENNSLFAWNVKEKEVV